MGAFCNFETGSVGVRAKVWELILSKTDSRAAQNSLAGCMFVTSVLDLGYKLLPYRFCHQVVYANSDNLTLK